MHHPIFRKRALILLGARTTWFKQNAQLFQGYELHHKKQHTCKTLLSVGPLSLYKEGQDLLIKLTNLIPSIFQMQNRVAFYFFTPLPFSASRSGPCPRQVPAP